MKLSGQLWAILTVFAAIAAHADQPIKTGDGIRFTQDVIFPAAMHIAGQSVRRYCDGHEVVDLNVAFDGQCCDLTVNSGWAIDIKIQTGPRVIRWAAPLKHETYLNVEVLPAELLEGEVSGNPHQILVRCQGGPATWDKLSKAFGNLIVSAQNVIERSPTPVKSLPNYPPQFLNNQHVTMPGTAYTIITHANPLWDTPKKTESATRLVIQESDRLGIPTVGLVSSATTEPYFYSKSEVKYVVQSEAGQINLDFPNLKYAVLSGGYLSACLCETLRDVARNGIREGKPLTLFLVEDAIFDLLAMVGETDLDVQNSAILREKSHFDIDTWFQAGEILRAGQWKIPTTDRFGFLLQDLVELKGGTENFMNHLSQYVIGVPRNNSSQERKFRTSICDQNGSGSPNLELGMVRFEVYLGNLKIGEMGPNPSAPFLVKLVLLKSSQLKDFIPR